MPRRSWNGSAATLGNFAETAVLGVNTTLSVDPSGTGGAAAVLVLAGFQTNLSSLMSPDGSIAVPGCAMEVT